MQSIKEHNLKANHNELSSIKSSQDSVCNLSKNTIWKQITTPDVLFFVGGILYAIYQRTQSESKSQLALSLQMKFQVCMQSIKEHNLKANHNQLRSISIFKSSVCNLSKNTIWKQITTSSHNLWRKRNLYAIYQRTQSESKSQQ